MGSIFRLGPAASATKVALSFRPPTILPALVQDEDSLEQYGCKAQMPLTSRAVKRRLEQAASRGAFSTKTIFTSMQPTRWVHTDVKFPDFEQYRRASSKDVTVPARDTEDARRLLTYSAYAGLGIGSLMFVKHAVRGVVKYKSMPPDMAAFSSIEIDLNTVPLGHTKTFEWRGKPIFVMHRTEEAIARERDTDLSKLRDPETDEKRAQRQEWLVIIGVCTHLGCIPIANKGNWPGGFLCPCHGSHYDGSGRIRQGPAPLNMEIPDYYFKDDTTLIVGE